MSTPGLYLRPYILTPDVDGKDAVAVHAPDQLPSAPPGGATGADVYEGPSLAAARAGAPPAAHRTGGVEVPVATANAPLPDMSAARVARAPVPADPIAALAMQLTELCREAADPLELAAHLESLGYNAVRIRHEFGLDSSFDLARELFVRTPRRPQPAAPAARRGSPWPARLLPGCALAVAMAIQALTPADVRAGTFWLLVWSQAGAVLFWQVRGETEAPHTRRVLGLTLLVGLLGAAAVAVQAGPSRFTVALLSVLWVGVAGLLWSGRPGQALVFVCFLGAGAWARVPTPILPALALAMLWLLMRPALARPDAGTVRWTYTHLRLMTPYALYGAGQGLLLLALFQGGGWGVLPGQIIFILVLFTAEGGIERFKSALVRLAWGEHEERRYAAGACWSIAPYAGPAALPFLIALSGWFILGGDAALVESMRDYALLGLAISLALALLCLQSPWPAAVAMVLGGALSLAGMPFLTAGLAAVAALLGALLGAVRQVYRYGLHLL